MAPDDIQQLPKGSKQASHAMLYTKLNEKLFGTYDMGYAILVSVTCLYLYAYVCTSNYYDRAVTCSEIMYCVHVHVYVHMN